MEEKEEAQIETADDLEAEKEHLGEVKEDDVREQVIKEYGFSPEDDEERITKAVEREMGYKKSISKTIGQKIKYRELATKKGESPKPAPESKKDDEVDLDSKIAQALEKDRLDAMEYPDDIKEAIARVAKIDGITVRKAISDPTIKAKIDVWQKKKDAEESALNRTDKGGKASKDDDSTPPEVDFNTPEGRKEYDDWRARQIKLEKKS